jgi:hypothetical protein
VITRIQVGYAGAVRYCWTFVTEVMAWPASLHQWPYTPDGLSGISSDISSRFFASDIHYHYGLDKDWIPRILVVDAWSPLLIVRT